MNLLHHNETIEDLQCGGYRIICDRNSFRFGSDAVFLAHFSHFHYGDRVADFGTGNGILPILICAREKTVRFEALEIQQDQADRASRSVALNALESRICVHHMDVQQSGKVFGKASFDAIVTNPPYGKLGGGPLPACMSEAIARFELELTLEQLFTSASEILKNGGRLFLSHRPSRFLEIMDTARGHRFCPRYVRFVYPTQMHEPKLVLLEFEKNGSGTLKFGKPLIIADSHGRYTEETAAIYNREGLLHR